MLSGRSTANPNRDLRDVTHLRLGTVPNKNGPGATSLPALRLFVQTLACLKTERIAGPVAADRGERPPARACAFWPPSHPARKTPRPCRRPPGPCGRG